MSRIVKGVCKTSSGRSLTYVSNITFLCGFGDILADGRQRVLQMNTSVEPVVPRATKKEIAESMEAAKLDYRIAGTSDLWGFPN